MSRTYFLLHTSVLLLLLPYVQSKFESIPFANIIILILLVIILDPTFRSISIHHDSFGNTKQVGCFSLSGIGHVKSWINRHFASTFPQGTKFDGQGNTSSRHVTIQGSIQDASHEKTSTRRWMQAIDVK